MAVTVEQRGQAAVVTIDRPERRNALDARTIRDLGDAFTEAENDDNVRAVVLTGAGDKAFCAGMDLKDFGTAEPGPGIEVFTTRCYPKPVIAAINGVAVGGGFEMMLAADLVVTADHVEFAVPEAQRGVVGAGCTTRLAARVSPAVAAEITFTGERFDTNRALELGLVNEVVPAAELMDRSLAMVERVCTAAPISLRITKELIWRETGMHDAQEWSEIRSLATPAFSSNDAAEGRAAFAEKRQPRWTGT